MTECIIGGVSGKVFGKYVMDREQITIDDSEHYWVRSLGNM